MSDEDIGAVLVNEEDTDPINTYTALSKVITIEEMDQLLSDNFSEKEIDYLTQITIDKYVNEIELLTKYGNFKDSL